MPALSRHTRATDPQSKYCFIPASPKNSVSRGWRATQEEAKTYMSISQATVQRRMDLFISWTLGLQAAVKAKPEY